MGPEAIFLLSAGSAAAQGIAGYQQAKGEQQRAEINSYIGRTRAMQTDTAARKGLSSELAQVRAVLGANQQRANVGVLDMLSEIRTERDRERRIEVGNRMSEAADWRIAGQNARASGRAALFGGFSNAGFSLFDYYNAKPRV